MALRGPFLLGVRLIPKSVKRFSDKIMRKTKSYDG